MPIGSSLLPEHHDRQVSGHLGREATGEIRTRSLADDRQCSAVDVSIADPVSVPRSDPWWRKGRRESSSGRSGGARRAGAVPQVVRSDLAGAASLGINANTEVLR
jgi:hypothetical protein